jgi:threonine dehydratase
VEEGSITFSLCQKYVHQFCTVEEGAIGKGNLICFDKRSTSEILNVLEWHHKLIEGAAGCALATLFHVS